MNSKKLYILMLYIGTCSTLTQAVHLSLPFPEICKKCLSEIQEKYINLRDAQDDTNTQSTECTITKVLFDKLFDEVITETIVIGAVITEDNKKLVVHYFDGYALMEYVMELWRNQTLLKDFTNNQYQNLKNSYTNATNSNDENIYTHDSENLTDAQKNDYLPIFVNPLNRQKILVIHFFKIKRKIQKNSSYDYTASYLGDFEQVLATKKTRSYFRRELNKNMPWQEKITIGIHDIKSLLEHKQDEEVITAAYQQVSNMLACKKDEFAKLNDKDAIVDAQFLQETLENFDEIEYKIGDYLYEHKKYKQALPYYEKQMQSDSLYTPEALYSAALLCLGYIKDAEEYVQLQGFSFYKILIEEFPEWDHGSNALDIASLAYDRAQTVEDYKRVIPYIETIVQDDHYHNLHNWAQAHLLMGKIRFQQQEYETAQHHFKKVVEWCYGHVVFYYQAHYWFNRTADLLKQKTIGTVINSYAYAYQNISEKNLKAEIAYSWAQALYKQCTEQGFDDQKVKEVENIFKRAKYNYLVYLQHATRDNLHINDHQRNSIGSTLQEIENRLAGLETMKPKPQKIIVLAASRKRGLENAQGNVLKRRKEK